MRRFLTAMLVAAMVLLMVGIGGGVAGRGSALARERAELAYAAAQQAQRLDDYFARARATILLTAQNPAFADFYTLPGRREERVNAGGPVLDRANAALGYLSTLFPDSVGEACLIDRSGSEIARTVHGQRAPVADLSNEEADAPFFAPTFALDAGQVYQARPYVSPDTDDWVISNSTLVPTADPTKRALVHFEVNLESFRREAAHANMPSVLVVEAGTGAVVIDAARPQRVGAALGNPEDRRFAGLVGGWGRLGRSTVDGRQLAYQQITSGPGNANRWYAVMASPEAAGPLRGVGMLPVLVVATALVLLAYVTWALRRARSALVQAVNTDPLTGLNNRRRLTADLNAGLAQATEQDPLLLVLCDLNGFKSYNDTFGHPAGDALLSRLGVALATAIDGRGQAYRIGGDEFCVLARTDADGVEPLVATVTTALTERGDGFHITASAGAVLLPAATRDPAEAMRLVDQRMYTHKNAGRTSAQNPSDVLMRALDAASPEITRRSARVAELTESVCRRMGLPEAEQQRLRQAAYLHDIGKVAVPDDVLGKPGPLDPAEWRFIEHGPLIAERIASVTPTLAPLAGLLRSVRERLDGSGYPDGLAGPDIPLGSRIIAACAAYTAMTSDRSYAPRLDRAEALAELHRHAGTQFDPDVLAALVDVIERDPVASRTPNSASRQP